MYSDTTGIGFAVRADLRRLYPANAKTPTCCPSDDNLTKVTNSVTSARSLWWHVGPYFWPADLTRTANPIVSLSGIDGHAQEWSTVYLLVCDPPILPEEDPVHVGRRLGQHTEKESPHSAAVVSRLWYYLSFPGIHLLDISLGKGAWCSATRRFLFCF